MTYLLTQEEFDALKADASKVQEKVATARKELAAQIRKAYTDEFGKLVITRSAENHFEIVVYTHHLKAALDRADKAVEAIK